MESNCDGYYGHCQAIQKQANRRLYPLHLERRVERDGCACRCGSGRKNSHHLYSEDF